MKTRIGIDYSDCPPLETEVSVLLGLKCIKNFTFKNVTFDEMVSILISICDTYNGKLNFENNKMALYAAFKTAEKLQYLENSPRDYLFHKLKGKGFCYTLAKRDLWDKYKYLFEYDETFEESVRIAALSMLICPTTFNFIGQLDRYTKEIQRIKDNIL